jgi:hypothetical protein
MKKKIFQSHIPYFWGKIAKSWGKQIEIFSPNFHLDFRGEGIVCTIFKKPFWAGCRKREHLMLHWFWDASISHNIKIRRKINCPPPMSN